MIQLITPRILVQAFNRCKTVSDPMNLSSLPNAADYGLSPLSGLEIKPSDGILRHSGYLSYFFELSVFHESGILEQTKLGLLITTASFSITIFCGKICYITLKWYFHLKVNYP